MGPQSIEMLKIRASLEEKLRQKGVFSSITPKIGRTREHLQPLNRYSFLIQLYVSSVLFHHLILIVRNAQLFFVGNLRH